MELTWSSLSFLSRLLGHKNLPGCPFAQALFMEIETMVAASTGLNCEQNPLLCCLLKPEDLCRRD